MHKHNLSEGLRYGDLEDYVSEIFGIDRYRSKMGEDRDIVVLNFKVKEKYPAIDLMEFIEKGYDFILDADISAGEENDGQYQVFVEIERTPNLTNQLKELIGGISHLCNFKEWNFRYQKSPSSLEFNEENITEAIPLTQEAYDQKITEIKESDIKNFFNKGSVNLKLDENNNLTFSRSFAQEIKAKFIAIGDYEDVKNIVPGKLSLDETSQSQVLFLTKYLGDYDIDKIQNKFLIKNDSRAIVIEKDKW
jgi:hypothetical protein